MQNYYSTIIRKVLFAVALVLPFTVCAQDGDDVITSYTNVFIRVVSVPGDGGTVAATPPNGGIKSFKNQVDFERTLPMAAELMAVYLYIDARPADGYSFVGWYVDINGNGELDQNEDEFYTPEENALILLPALDDWQLYENEADAKAGEKPSAPQYTIFAYFTSGASVQVEHHQNDFGTVSIDKPQNSAGDVVTVSATPVEGYHFAYWKSKFNSTIHDEEHAVVSTENPYTFTVQGGEQLYAYFIDDNAPAPLEFPEEGGWKVATFDQDWVLHEQSKAIIYKFNSGDLIRTPDGQVAFNTDEEEAKFDVVSRMISGSGSPTLIYGEGKVFFSYREPWGYDRRNNILCWSGKNGVTVSDANHALLYHVYAFNEAVGAFTQIGTTDDIADPTASESVNVPAETCYFAISAYDMLANDAIGEDIPTVIALPHDRITRNVFDITAAIRTPRADTPSIPEGVVYDLSGRRVERPVKGFYIIGGKKIMK